MTGPRRIWSELLPLAEVRAPRTLALLRRFDLSLLVAVRPETEAHLPELAAACADAGVPLAVWPMLADEDGRWASAGNAALFEAFVARLLDTLDARGLALPEVAVDLEPPIALVRGALDGLAGLRALLFSSGPRGGRRGGDAPARSSWDDAERAFSALAARLHARGAATSAAAVPLLLLDGPERGWERLLATPVSAPPWGRINVMLYTSILAGWSRGLLRRADVVAVLAWACRAAVRRFGPGVSVSLGAVGVGALGDEPTYRSVDELREDVAVAVAAGVSDLALFDLGGVLGRPPAEVWLEAFVAPAAPREVAPTLRARCGVLSAGLVGRAGRALAAFSARSLPRRVR